MTDQTRPATMGAAVVPRHGGGDVLVIEQRPIPTPGPGQLLVQVAASGVNFRDVYLREGGYVTNKALPFVLGDECAGRVVALGPDAGDFAVGDVVAAADSITGTHAEAALVNAAQAVPVPTTVAPDVAAAALLQGMTAHYLVRSTYPVADGDDVLIHAAAGGVGQLLVQMAKAQGARVIATVGSAAKVEIARAVGADHVIRYDQIDDLAGAVRAIAPDGVQVAYDGVGRATFDASLASVRRRGLVVLYGASSGAVPPFELQRLNSSGSLFVTRPTLLHYVANRAELLERAADVFTQIADGRLTIAIGGRYPLADVAQAYADLEGRRTSGKLLIIP